MSKLSRPQSQEPQDQFVQPEQKGTCDSLPPGDFPSPVEYAMKRGDRFVPDQFIVTGVTGDIERVVARLPTQYRDLPQLQVRQIDLSILGRLSPPGREGEPSEEPGEGSSGEPEIRLRYQENRLANLVTRVYRLPENVALGDAISEFHENAITEDVGVYAEPNYLIGNPDIAGNPGCIEGGPAGPGTITGGGQQDFLEQWAFGCKGIGLRAPPKKPGGKGVRVAVFDTSPFSGPGKWRIPWIEPHLDLCVSHPQPLVHMRPEGDVVDYRDHGLFVASMVHAVARLSDIHLIRVLNEHNLGDLGTLVKALCDFLLADSQRRGGSLDRTVLNLSLGLRNEPGHRWPWLNKMKGDMETLDQVLQFVRMPPLDKEIPVVCLETVLAIARRSGAIVVAAAGNESDVNPQTVVPPMIPASYPFVIGVAGHNYDQGRSNFSNKGDIAAPGGDRREPPPLFTAAGKAADPKRWLIGLSMHKAQVDGYMYWMGTSFAAPLVSGLAARILGKPTPPGYVRAQIETDADPHPDANLGHKKAKVKD